MCKFSQNIRKAIKCDRHSMLSPQMFALVANTSNRFHVIKEWKGYYFYYPVCFVGNMQIKNIMNASLRYAMLLLSSEM